MEPDGSLNQRDVFPHTFVPEWPVSHTPEKEKTLLNVMKCKMKEN